MFNVRVYGILVNEKQQVLVSDEFIRGNYYTKFPGGGLEVGEGTRQCLVREFNEEMGLRISVLDHIYTTDFYQQSAFNPAQQIISIYYKVKALEEIKVSLRKKAFQFDPIQMQEYARNHQIESFRFISLPEFSEASVSLPIDKIVAGMIREEFLKTYQP